MDCRFQIWLDVPVDLGLDPDDALNAAADANQLVTEEQVLAQAQRMATLRDKTAPAMIAFHVHPHALGVDATDRDFAPGRAGLRAELGLLRLRSARKLVRCLPGR